MLSVFSFDCLSPCNDSPTCSFGARLLKGHFILYASAYDAAFTALAFHREATVTVVVYVLRRSALQCRLHQQQTHKAYKDERQMHLNLEQLPPRPECAAGALSHFAVGGLQRCV